MDIPKFSFIGGDLRSAAACQYLCARGIPADTYLLENAGLPCPSASSFPVADCYVLGLPASSDGTFLYTPLSRQRLLLSDFFPLLPAGAAVFGGRLSPDVLALSSSHGVRIEDYADREDFRIRNAVPTAEGALEIALRELPVTLAGARVLIVGYGRITRALIPMLTALGSRVSVASRRPDHRAWIENEHLEALSIDSLSAHLSTVDLIINTAPALIFDEALLSFVAPGTLLLDLASRPGGVDEEKAAARGLSVICAPGLPGKCAPVTAGRIIGDTVYSMAGR